MKAQMGLPDMRLPIQYALGFPVRLRNNFPRFSFFDYPKLTFENPDKGVFRNLTLALNSLKCGGNMPCVLNAANEITVDAFLHDRIPFHVMPDIIEKTMKRVGFIEHPSLEDYTSTDSEARQIALELI
jgi:1-deoxy-D-xylulose-5-phosphate reductoisomerase